MMVFDYKLFLEPTPEFRSMVFWSLNDVLQAEEIRRQIKEFKEAGVGGVCLHSRIGLLAEYLGDEWWMAMDAAISAAEALGVEIWLYDEDKWPSGYAGGKVPLASEDYHARMILKLERSTSVSCDDELLFEDEKYKYVCYKLPLGDPWFNGTCWVDLLNPDTVKAFLHYAYEPYVDRYFEKFGCVVKGIFTDEPQVSPRTRWVTIPYKAAIPYSPVIRGEFIKMHGYDFVDHIQSLFEDTGDYAKVRYDYYRTIAIVFENSFSKQIGRYCQERNLILTGHYNGEESFDSVRLNVGNMMMQYRHMSRPGIDHLGLGIGGQLNSMRSLSSVANQYGLARRLSEMFGISGQNMSFEDRKWIANCNILLGVNHVCEHLSLYSMKGCRKRDYPPTISYQQPYWAYNKLIEDYMARMSYVCTVGQYAPEFLVIHPLESSYIDKAAGTAHRDRRFEGYYSVLEILQGTHRDYDLGDEQILADIGSVCGSHFCVGKMKYKAVILPFMLTVRCSTLKLLEEFASRGGRIIMVGTEPEYIDGRTDREGIEKLKEISQFVLLEDLKSTIQRILPPVVRLEGEDSDLIWIQRRVLHGGELIILSNTSRLKALDFRVIVEGEKKAWSVLDPATGSIMSIEKDSTGALLLHLSPAQSLILASFDSCTDNAAFTDNAKLVKYSSPVRGENILELSGPWRGRRLDPNAISLDFARYSVDGGKTFSEREPVIGIHERFTDLQYNGPLVLAFDVQIEKVPSMCSLVVEQPEMYSGIFVNDKPVVFDTDEFYVDLSFKKVDVSGFLKEGNNIVQLVLDYVAPIPTSLKEEERYGTEIESIYLVGDFGVRGLLSQSNVVLTQRNRCGYLPEQDVHCFSSFVITEEWCDEIDEDLVLAGYPFYSGSFELVKQFEITDPASDYRYFLVFPKVEAIAIEVEFNGSRLTPLVWSPYEVEITDVLRRGSNEVKITLVNSLRNLLGPHHHRDGELIGVGPVSFTGSGGWPDPWQGEEDWYEARKTGKANIWRDDYYMVPLGLLQSPMIEMRPW